jgi:hypothetical protein
MTRALRPFRSAAAASLTAAVATGAGVQLGVLDTSRARWVHHALYAAAGASCAAVAVTAVVAGTPVGMPLALVLGGLAVLPMTSGGTIGHGTVAAIVAVGYGVELVRRR